MGGGGGGGGISITKSGGGGGGFRFRSITKRGGGGGSDVSGVWVKAPEALQAGTRTTLADLDPFLGGGGGGGFVRTPRTPPGYGLV